MPLIPRQSLQRGEPQRQIPTEGNPPAELAPQRAGSTPWGPRVPHSPFPFCNFICHWLEVFYFFHVRHKLLFYDAN